MTYLDIDQALVDITRERCAACKARLDAIPKENTTERKAVQLELGMYTFCGNAGLLYNDMCREKVLQIRQCFWNRALLKYPRLNDVFQKLDQTERMRCMTSLQAELFIRDQWLGAQYAALSAAETAGDTKTVFELKIKIGAVRSMLDAWKVWRKENGVYPHMFEEEQ